MSRPLLRVTIVKPHDARGWIGLGVYVLVIILLCMMWADKALLKDDFFKTIATLIIGTGFINGPVGWAYQATKAGGEMAESSQRIAEEAAKRLGPNGSDGGSVDDMQVDAENVTVKPKGGG